MKRREEKGNHRDTEVTEQRRKITREPEQYAFAFSVLLSLKFLSCREDFFGNCLLDLVLVAPGVWELEATSGFRAQYDSTCETQGRA